MKALALLPVLLAAGALANGAVISPDALTPASRGEYFQEISAARLSNPGAFAALEKLHGQLGSLDAKKRGPVAPTVSYLRSLGPDALWPMVEQVAFRGLPRGELNEMAWSSWTTGLVEALSNKGDARLSPLFTAVLSRPEVDGATRAAVQGLGLIGGDAEVATLLAAKSGPARVQVLAGLGHCRRLACADAIATELSATRDPSLALELVRSLGDVANAYAWQTPLVSAKSEEGAIRALAARALVDAFARFEGRTGEAALTALVVVESPEAKGFIARAERNATGEAKARLTELAARYEKRARK